jgi:hypothetical protein
MGPVCSTVTRRALHQVSRQADQDERRAEWENENSSLSPSEQEQIDNFMGVPGSGVLDEA